MGKVFIINDNLLFYYFDNCLIECLLLVHTKIRKEDQKRNKKLARSSKTF